jgi:nucleoside-triphosphatase THEP1
MFMAVKRKPVVGYGYGKATRKKPAKVKGLHPVLKVKLAKAVGKPTIPIKKIREAVRAVFDAKQQVITTVHHAVKSSIISAMNGESA